MQPISNSQSTFVFPLGEAVENSRTESSAELPAKPDAFITMNPGEFQEKLNSGSLPGGPIHVTGDLKLTDNDALANLPASLTVNGDLSMVLCRSLKSLPPELAVRGSLFVILCTSLTSLPVVLDVGMNLDIEGCTSLTSLPETLTLGGYLRLLGCTSLRSLPTKLVLGGFIDLEGCISVTSLPDWIKELGPQRDGQSRHVYLTGTGLSKESIDRLRTVEAPGVHFRFSQQTFAINQRICILP